MSQISDRRKRWGKTTSGNIYSLPINQANFRVVESVRRDGKLFYTIECDSPSAGIIIHFLKIASEFGHRLNFMAEGEARSRERESERLAGEPERRARRAETLKLYDSMKGVPPSKRIARVREILSAQGQQVRYCEVEADINLARDDERRELESRMRDAAVRADADDDEMKMVEATGTGTGMMGRVYSGGYRRESAPLPTK